MGQRDQTGPSNGQRALWVFLAATLIGPLIGAIVIFVLTIAAGQFGFGPASAKAAAAAGQLAPLAAERAVLAYVWGAFPAALAGAVTAAWLTLKHQLPWLLAVTAGGVSTTIASIITGGAARDHITPLAFISALAALVVWLMLRRARIIPAE